MAGQTTAKSQSDSRASSMPQARSTYLGRRNKWILYSAVLACTFMAGFLPQYLRANRLSHEVQRLSWQNQIATTRDLAGLMFLEGANNNFGFASVHASTFFDHVRQMSHKAEIAAERDTLQQISEKRDSITAGVAKADPAVRAQAPRTRCADPSSRSYTVTRKV